MAGSDPCFSLQMEALGEIAPGKETAGASDCHAVKRRLRGRQGSQGLCFQGLHRQGFWINRQGSQGAGSLEQVSWREAQHQGSVSVRDTIVT